MTWELREGDCLDPVTGLASLPDGSVDVVITDPPYSERVHARLGREGRSDGHDVRRPLEFGHLTSAQAEAVAQQCARVAKRWCLFFGDEFTSVDWRLAAEQAGCEYVRTGAWVKNDPMPQMTGDRPAPGWESIVIVHAPGRVGRMRWNGGGRSAVWMTNVSNNRGRSENRHPAQKPEDLMERLVEQFSDPGETILDPYAGSGTTCVAAIRLGRNFIGWEKDPKYAEVARRRLSAAREQLVIAPRGPKPKQGGAVVKERRKPGRPRKELCAEAVQLVRFWCGAHARTACTRGLILRRLVPGMAWETVFMRVTNVYRQVEREVAQADARRPKFTIVPHAVEKPRG